MSFNKVDDFLEKLAMQAPKAKEEFKPKNRVLEKIYLNYPGNFGRYQIFPMDSIVTDFPFQTLFDTREINIPRKNLAADGTVNVYNAWIKLLPKSAYIMKDATGRQVSSLSAADELLLGQAHMVFDQLCNELDMRNNRAPEVTNLVRKRNYTVFFGYCLNKWNSDSRTPERQNFCGLFVCTAKGFITSVEENITERTLMNGGDSSWIPSVYNRQLSGRDGFLMFSIQQNKMQAGYSVTASHEFGRAKNLEGTVISEEDAELMVDPVEAFLGWQANRDESAPGTRRLFNPTLTQEAITFMTEQLAAIRMAKQTGMTIADAIENTNNQALANQQFTNTQGQATNDPMLAEMAKEQETNFSQVDPSKLAANNDPYSTPPAAHIDPVTNAPNKSNPFGGGFGGQQNNTGSAPFNPSFSGGFGDRSNGMPF
jgi:hypothetical protein